jgi:hypothetical protein
LEVAVDTALEQARRDWEQAFRLAHGHGPETAAPLAMAAPPPAAAPPPVPDMALGGHAYELFTTWDTERTGFGAYTYVLLRNAADLQRADVMRRWVQLTKRLARERPASEVTAAEAGAINLFCIPATTAVAGRGAEALQDLYAKDLGWQLMARANGGLMARPEIKSKLARSAGPFLVTLPTRMALARSGTPLLLADLSGYPDEAIADLVDNYMGGLLNDFPTQQALWKPPVPQRVALTMVRLAGDVGALVQTLIPGAQAAER